jgi:predicted nucleotidyltransferase
MNPGDRSRDPDRMARLSGAIDQAVRDSGLPIVAVWLHGSWATAYERADSDLDLGLLGDRPLSWTDRGEFVAKLARLLDESRDIDAVDLLPADSVFAAMVVSTGERVFSRGDAAQRFEIRALSGYARLNEERGEILRDILERGTIRRQVTVAER